MADKIRDPYTAQLRNVTDLDSNRIRFNGGYHDGAGEAKSGAEAQIRITNLGYRWKEKHFDPIYVQGYEAGWEDYKEGRYTGNSSDAWKSSHIPQGHAGYKMQKTIANVVYTRGGSGRRTKLPGSSRAGTIRK